MGPLVAVPATIRRGLAPSREVLGRAAGLDQVRRSLPGLLLRPHTTVQGSEAGPVWEPGAPRRRRAMPAGVCAAGGAADAWRPPHRAVIAEAQRGRGRAVIRLAGTSAHHERGPKMGGVQQAWAPVAHRLAPSQTVMPAVMAHWARLDGIAVLGPQPHRQAEALAYWQETRCERSPQREEARGRVLELLHHLGHRLGEKKRTARALDIVPQLAQAGPFPSAHDPVDHGVLRRELRRGSAHAGPHGGSEPACARHSHWQGQGPRVETVAQALRPAPPARVRAVRGPRRHGETKPCWVLTKGRRLKRYGRKRLVIGPAPADRGEAPRFLLTDARPWDSRRVLETWR